MGFDITKLWTQYIDYNYAGSTKNNNYEVKQNKNNDKNWLMSFKKKDQFVI